MISKSSRAALFTLVAVLPGLAWAQNRNVPTFELERLELNPSGLGSLLLGSGQTLKSGGYRASLLGNYANEPLALYQSGQKVGAVVQDRVTVHATAAYALADRFELGLQIPFVVSQSFDRRLDGIVAPPSSSGLGTPFISGKVGLVRADADLPVDVALQASIGLPVGQGRAIARSNGVLVIPKLQASTKFGPLLAAAEAGAYIRPEVENLGRTTYGSELLLGAGLATTGDGLNGEIALRGGVSMSNGPSSMELLAGPRIDLTKDLELFALGGIGLGSAPGTPVFRALAGIGYGGTPEATAEPLPLPVGPPASVNPCAPGRRHTPAMCPENDDDEDRIKNKLDSCPLEAEDRDGFKDEDGCNDKDNDGDAIEDERDKCPDVAGTPDQNGCPPPDGDKDGILDAADQCPSEAGPAERKGCPFKDGDSDGVEDASDRCPTEAGLLELRGCPAKDGDGDGISDHLDNCPAEKGLAKNQGCKAKQLVIITKEKLVILDKVFFTSGKAKLLPKSNKLLDQIAAVLKSHADIEKVVVEGHTDDKGSADKNRVLSQERAEAVKAYLVKKGVDAARLEPKGFGPDRPADTNLTSGGRENNRRVEFIIPDASAPSSTSTEPATSPAPAPAK